MFATAPRESSYRPLNALGLLLCSAATAFAVVYLEGKLGLAPCPLCTAARLVVIIQALLFLLAFLHNPRQLGQRCYALLGFLVAICGMVVSGRHVWLQSLPAEEVPACGPGLTYLFDTFPFSDALGMILNGSGECATIQWQLIGLSLPQQTFLLFLVLGLITLSQLRKKTSRSYFS